MLSCTSQTAQQISPNDTNNRPLNYLSIFVESNLNRTQRHSRRPLPLAQNGKPRRAFSYQQLPSLLLASWCSCFSAAFACLFCTYE